MPRLTGAQFLADTLHLHEVTHVFFVPAILNQTLAEMELRETGIDRVMTHGEKSAVYMADGFARVSGRPGITFAQCVGAANLAAALRDPYLACSPVVALTGGPYHDTRHRHTYQEIDDFSLFPAVTKSSTRGETIDRLPDAISRAFRDATSGTPGPTHIELLGHMGEIELEELDVELRQEPAITSVPATRTAAANRDVQQAVQVLQESHRPVIVAGGGVKSSGAGPVLLQLAETLGIPVATSLNAKDTLPANHPLNIGVPGHYCRKSANQALLDADLVFFVGSRTGSQVTARWKIPPTSTPAIRHCLASGIRVIARVGCRTAPTRANLQRPDTPVAFRRHPGIRNRPQWNVDRWNDRPESFDPVVHQGSRVIGMGPSGDTGGQAGRPGSTGRAVLR